MPRLSLPITIHPYGLLGLGAGLAALHLTLLERFAHANQFSSSLLLWVAIATLIHRGRDRHPGCSLADCCLSGVILVGLLGQAITLSHYEPQLRLWPLLGLLVLGLLRSGWQRLGQYWRAAIAWAVLMLPPGPIMQGLDLTPLTAQLASYLLWYFGWPVTRMGTDIHLPNGSLTVATGCSGVESCLQLLGLAVLFILCFQPGWCKSGLALGGAIALALGTNAARVALMAVLNAQLGQAAFDYWHQGDGSHLFSLLAVTLFGALCLVLNRQD